MVKANLVTETADSGTQFVYNVQSDAADRRYCKCGCNQQVVSKKLYRPGHDARHVATLVAQVSSQSTRAKIRKVLQTALDVLDGSPRLQLKLVTRLMSLGVEGIDDFADLAVNEDDAAESE